MNKFSKSRLFVIAILMCFVFILGACQSDSKESSTDTTEPTESTNSSDEVAEDNKYGGVLKVGIAGSIQGLGINTDIRTTNDLFISSTALESLARFDENGYLEPLLAESWEEDSESQTITINLRQGVQFHDGTDLNAEAVKWNLDLLSDRPQFETIANVEVVDEHTLKVELNRWQNGLMNELGFYAISSPTAYEELGKEGVLMNPVGTGPYQFDGMSSDEYIHFKAFDGYWQEGKPYLDRIEFTLFADSTTASLSMQSGEIDIYYGAPAVVANELQNIAGIDVHILKTGIGAGLQGVVYDSANPNSPFADEKVRRAITHAIDREVIVDNLLYGFALPTTQWGPTESPTFNPDLDLDYNPDKARQLLADAGYPEGFKTNFVVSSDSTQVEFATAIQGFLAEVGVEVNLEVVDGGRHRELTVAAEGQPWDGMITWSTRGDYDVGTFMPRNFAPNGTLYAHHLKHYDDMEEVYVQVQSTGSEEEWINLSKELQRLGFDEYAIGTPVYISAMPFPVYEYVQDGGFNVGHPTRYTPEEVWMNK